MHVLVWIYAFSIDRSSELPLRLRINFRVVRLLV